MSNATKGQKEAIIESLRNLTEIVKLNLPGFDLQTGLDNLSRQYAVPVDDLIAMMEKEDSAAGKITNALNPRDFRAPAKILAQDYQTMLAHDPKAFDCLIFPALPGEEETVAVADDPVGSIDAGERAQRYGEPVLGRALIVPEEGLGFEVLAGEVANSFLGVTAPMNILLSMPVHNYSLIQWKEYATPDAEEPEIRTVYVLSAKAVGRVAGAGTVYVCAPLPALGEIPEVPDMPEEPEPVPPEPDDPEEGDGADDAVGVI